MTDELNELLSKIESFDKESEKMPLPDYLKSGTYYYTFRLDMNYNYILVSKEIEQK